jgi:hypothetical protein
MSDPTQPLPPTPRQQGGAEPDAPAGPPGQPPGGAAPPAYQPQPEPGAEPQRGGAWRRATSTRGGIIALAVAGALVALLVLGSLGLGAVMAARLVTGGGDGDRGVGIERGRSGPFDPDSRRGDDDGPRMDRPPGAGERMGPMGPGLRGLGDVQHGEFTMTGSDGRPVVMLVQRGEVTRASATSVTVRSTDGFTATYAVNNDTRLTVNSAADLRAGDPVAVLARKEGAVAVFIRSGARG